MIDFINNYILFWNSWYILLSLWVSLIIFVYAFFLFKGKKIIHTEREVKLTPWIILKEYHFYVLFVLLGFISLFFVETMLYGIILACSVLLWVYMYLFTGSSKSYSWWDYIEIGDIEVVPEESVKKSEKKKEVVEMDSVSGLSWQEKWEKAVEWGTEKESMPKNMVIGIIWLLVTTGLSLSIYFNALQSWQFVQTYSAYAFLGPLIYTIMFWLAYTDRLWLVIMDRFLYLLIGIWLLSIAITFPIGVEDTIVVIFFFAVLLILLSLFEWFGLMPPIGYMDIPVMFALWLVFSHFAIMFIMIMLVGNILVWFAQRIIKWKEGLRKIWMYRYAYIWYILMLITVFLSISH